MPVYKPKNYSDLSSLNSGCIYLELRNTLKFSVQTRTSWLEIFYQIPTADKIILLQPGL